MNFFARALVIGPRGNSSGSVNCVALSSGNAPWRSGNSSWKSGSANWKKDNKTSYMPNRFGDQGRDGRNKEKEKESNLNRTRDIKCFKCWAYSITMS